MAVKYPRYEYITMPDGRIAALSFSGNNSYYRGENDCFPSCKSSLYRITGRDNQIYAILKSYDFMIFLESLPEVQACIQENFFYEPWALAQHYEFATPMIDLTSELAVAAFFATHYYDRVCKQFLVKESGIGRIRRIFNIIDPMLKGPLKPIGAQPFARPERQDGYGYWISEEQDFVNHSFCIEFYQDKYVNNRLNVAMMDGVDYYFPNEQITQMATIIKNTNAVTSMAIERMLKDISKGNSFISPAVTKEDIERVIKINNTFIVDAPVICPEALPPKINGFMAESRLLVLPAYRNDKI